MAADTLSTLLAYLIMGTGNDNNNWGDNANSGVFAVFENAIAGADSRAVTGGTLDLSAAPLVKNFQIFTGTLTANQTVLVPNLTKSWRFYNNTTGAFSLLIKTPSGTAVQVPQGCWRTLFCDGANGVYREDRDKVGIVEDFAGTAVPAGKYECNGAALSRTGTPDLYAKIGTTWGAGDGVTTYNLPLLTDTGRFRRSRSGSLAVGTYQANEIASHAHGASSSASSSANSTATSTATSTAVSNATSTATSTATSSATSTASSSASTSASTTVSGSMDDQGTHNHTGSVGAGGGHGHTASSDTQGAHTHSGTTDNGGVDHTHTQDGANGLSASVGAISATGYVSIGNKQTGSASAYLHTHTFGTSSSGAHSHAITVNSVADHSHGISLDGGHHHNLSLSGTTSASTTVGTTVGTTVNTTVGTTVGTSVSTTVNTSVGTTVNTSVSTSVTTTINAFGGAETRPEAAVFIACISY